MRGYRVGNSLFGQLSRFAGHHAGHGQLTVQPGWASPMIAEPVTHLLADLGVTKSHNRPHVDNDNPHSESHFGPSSTGRTFRGASGSSRTHAHRGRFLTWCNDDHHHSGIGFHAPSEVHYGGAELVREQRAWLGPDR